MENDKRPWNGNVFTLRRIPSGHPSNSNGQCLRLPLVNKWIMKVKFFYKSNDSNTPWNENLTKSDIDQKHRFNESDPCSKNIFITILFYTLNFFLYYNWMRFAENCIQSLTVKKTSSAEIFEQIHMLKLDLANPNLWNKLMVSKLSSMNFIKLKMYFNSEKHVFLISDEFLFLSSKTTKSSFLWRVV